MAYENIVVHSTRGGIDPVDGWRQDLVALDHIELSLVGINVNLISSRHWWLVGRPEGSTAGSAGPEPIDLGVSATAVFTVDADVGLALRDGTYIVHCILDVGLPTETTITVGLARMTGLQDPEGRPLRRLGGFEVSEDAGDIAVGDTAVAQGWLKMLNRWLGKVVALSGGVPGATSLRQAYASGLSSADQVIKPTDALHGPVVFDGQGVMATETDIVKFLTSGGALSVEFLRAGGIKVSAGGVQSLPGLATGAATQAANIVGFGDGVAAVVAPSGQGRLRYNNLTKHFELSVDSGAWTPFLTGTSGLTTLNVLPSGTPLSGDVHLEQGAGSSIIETAGSSKFTFSVIYGAVGDVKDIAATASAGVRDEAARIDHVHKGVLSISDDSQALFGNVEVVGEDGISVDTTSGQLVITAPPLLSGAIIQSVSYPSPIIKDMNSLSFVDLATLDITTIKANSKLHIRGNLNFATVGINPLDSVVVEVTVTPLSTGIPAILGGSASHGFPVGTIGVPFQVPHRDSSGTYYADPANSFDSISFDLSYSAGINQKYTVKLRWKALSNSNWYVGPLGWFPGWWLENTSAGLTVDEVAA